MLLKDYEKLHEEYLQLLVEYHNAYLSYIKHKQTQDNYNRTQRVLRKMRNLNHKMLQLLLEISKDTKANRMDKYLEQRSRSKKNGQNSQ